METKLSFSRIVSFTGLAALLLLAGCSAPGTHERRGTEIGAVSGAILGGIIGHQSGETAEGAAIGAVVGGAIGAATGAAQDRKENDVRYERGMVHAQPQVDDHGYTLDGYLRLMTDEEMEILQARSDANPSVPMGNLLTDQEKANLRRRAVGSQEIGG
jgi:uncharacterized membrane protein